MALFSDVLLTVDFDRTLTAPDSTIPERNMEAIRYFIDNGGAFTVNTGRSVPMFRKYLNTIPHSAPWLLYNGSAAYDGETMLEMPIAMDKGELLEAIHARYPEIHIEEQGVDTHYCYWDDPVWMDFYEHTGIDHARADYDDDTGPFLKISMFGKPKAYDVANLFAATAEEMAYFDELEQWLNEQFGDKLVIFRAAARIIDIHAKGSSKLGAARALQAQMGRKILVCVGDAHNDVPMLEGADHAFCPADGIVADRFPNVCKCGDGAVADVIYEKIPEILENRS